MPTISNRLTVFLLGGTVMMGCDSRSGDFDERRHSLRMAISGRQEHRVPFVAKNTGAHQIRVDFPLPIADEHAYQFVAAAVQSVSTKTLPREFDFTWQVFRETHKVAEGSSQSGVLGIVDVSSASLGSNWSPQVRGLVVGKLRLEAGVEYTFSLMPTPEFGVFLQASPIIVIESQDEP